MALIRLTLFDNRPTAIEPNTVLSIRTIRPADRKAILGWSADHDPKTELRFMLDGKATTIFLRNPPRRLARKLLSIGAVRFWLDMQMADGGVGFTRPTALALLEGVPAAERAAEDYDGAESIAMIRLGHESVAWRCTTPFDIAFAKYEDLLAKETGAAGPQAEVEDDVGGVDDDEDAFAEDSERMDAA